MSSIERAAFAVRVICSCKTVDQLYTARQWVQRLDLEQYHKSWLNLVCNKIRLKLLREMVDWFGAPT